MRSITLIFLLISISANTQIVSSFNNLPIEVKNVSEYSFLVGGHFHGSSTNISGFPAASLLANINKINDQSDAFLISTGDLFLDVQNNIPNYQVSFFDRLKIPLFNAVGNHDVSGDVYNQHFGNTWFSFVIGTELFVILDGEINDGSIKGKQLEFLKEVLETNCNEHTSVKNVFIFSHRPIWAEDNPKLKNIFLENTQSDFGNNFQKEVLPVLRKNSTKQKFYWFSGSLGANAPASFFYYVDENKIAFIQSAIRDLPRDGLVKVKINNSKISFETVSFSNQKMPVLESCGLNLWKNAPMQQSFNYRLIPLYIKQMVFHRYFWYGLLIGIVLLILIRKIFRKLKSKKIA